MHACKCSDESARYSAIVSIDDTIFLRSRVCYITEREFYKLIGVAYAAVRWLRGTERHGNFRRWGGIWLV